MERWAWNTFEKKKKKRGSSEKRWRKRLQKYVTKKKRKLSMIMEYNKKKMCGSFCHFLFFIWCYYHCLFFEDQYFQGGVPFWRTFSKDAVFVFCIVSCLIYSGCSHHSKWVLAKKTKRNNINKKRSIVPTYPNPTPAPLPFLSQV